MNLLSQVGFSEKPRDRGQGTGDRWQVPSQLKRWLNLVPRADFVRFRFDFTEQSTLETTPGIDQFDWLMSFQWLS